MQKAIFLCGFMGAGKSSVGAALAQRLSWPLLDTDAMIEEQYGPISQIFAEKGESYFRSLEAQLAGTLSHKERAVIATGGGFVLADAVREQLKDSTVVYLSVPFELCYERIKDSDRPLVKANSREQLNDIYKKRDSVYRLAATYCMDNARPLEETVQEIVEKCK